MRFFLNCMEKQKKKNKIYSFMNLILMLIYFRLYVYAALKINS